MDIIKEFEKYLQENYIFNNDKENNTTKGYLSDVKLFLNYFKETFDEDIITFSRGHFIEYKQYMQKEKQYKYTTINRKIASLSIYEDFLLEKGFKKDDSKIIKKKDFFKIDSGLITAEMLPRDTIRKVRLKAGANKRDYMIFVILNEGGLRVSELINLELNRDVNLDMRKLLILGKGNKAREIFINNIMYDAIEDYLPEREKILNGRTNKYLIVSNKTANTNRPIERTSINNLLNKYCKSINEKCINPHILRHECATKRYEEGYSDMMLKKILGQTSNVTNRYVHAGNENIKR